MSTFDGVVKEFPSISIDYFRLSPGRPPLAACFLSHVHSDHLLGLESLRMPFVYCSATTRRILLRMEKYPHRINFAKGILESRKQHYKHLKTVLRGLPLQTPTELELGPKSSIRVTLLDANHCPGAVMFLIEDDGKAILYTGDIRAEAWWVNSVVQNPIILPYTCGQKRLDCIYLDTTFASHEDRYRAFPTKAEGLKELSSQVSKLNDDTIFYFRAWTLGYEQVWMSLCNTLDCQVHVDPYQLQLFNTITESGRDGYSMFEGPALTGFTFGNQQQSGCLSTDQDTRLHSCEPGSPCHLGLKNKNVVWITPIISRLQDGTELLEIGAGGGGGDLYQTAKLDIQDLATIEALQSFANETFQDKTIVARLQDALARTSQTGEMRIPLDTLGLGLDEEVSIKRFVQLMSSTSQPNQAQEACEIEPGRSKDRIIHFPYSRHSSYDELRHLVSMFRPGDLCACTVELEGWTEEISMQSLFGDLCTNTTYCHDAQVRREVGEFKAIQEAEKSLKRKRDNDSQSQGREDAEESRSFQSARAELSGVIQQGEAAVDTANSESLSQRPLAAPSNISVDGKNVTDSACMTPQLQAVRDVFRALNGGSDIITANGGTRSYEEDVLIPDDELNQDSQCTLSTSAFDSQLLREEDENIAGLDGTDEYERRPRDIEPEKKLTRVTRRVSAYRAARSKLGGDTSGSWEDLDMRSSGKRWHTDEEEEL